MSVLYDPDSWLTSASRALKDYIEAQFDPGLVQVELNFPDVEKLIPLEKVLIHLEQDAVDNPRLGFGTPGVEVYDETTGMWQLNEAQVHELNFDVGVWVSRELGGGSMRMEVTQKLIDTFTPSEARKQMLADTGGILPLSFTGGRNELDRINDVPVWRTIDMTLVVRVVSRHIPAPLVAIQGMDNVLQDPQLTISDDAGGESPVD